LDGLVAGVTLEILKRPTTAAMLRRGVRPVPPNFFGLVLKIED